MVAGVPVIVPAATWLADQIAAANQRHVAEVLRTSAVLGSATPTNGEAWPLPASATDVAIECRGDRAPVGAYARLSVVQFDQAGHELDRCTLVDRPLEGAEGWASLVHIVSRATSLAVHLSDLDFVGSQDSQPATGHLAGSSGVALDRRWSLVGIHALGASSEWTSGRPLGAVGLSAADEREFGRQLREICRFHPHYLATARRFAVDYAQRHSADMIFGTLIQSRPASPIAVRAA